MLRTWMFALALLGSLSGALVFSADPSKLEYKPYASSVGRYKCVTPAPMKTETIDLKTDLGPIKLTLDSTEANDASFVVSFLDYPETAPKVEPSVRLAKVRDGNKGQSGVIVTDTDLAIGIDKYPCKDVVINKGESILRARIVVVGNRLYQVMVSGTQAFVTSPDANQFLESFEVTR